MDVQATPQKGVRYMSQIEQAEKSQEVHRVATELYQQNPDWVTFFREVLGIDGVVRKAYADPTSLTEFEKTQEYCDIQQMVAKLRERNGNGAAISEEIEPTRVITVRMPKSLHESLRVEAHDRHTSMNKLCISKLLQMIDDQLVPQEI
jgi:predicted HicB family RNase H-like nuclease